MNLNTPEYRGFIEELVKEFHTQYPKLYVRDISVKMQNGTLLHGIIISDNDIYDISKVFISSNYKLNYKNVKNILNLVNSLYERFLNHKICSETDTYLFMMSLSYT